MSKSLGNVLDPNTVIEGGQNSKVWDWKQMLFLFYICTLNVSSASHMMVFILHGRIHLVMEQMSSGSGYLV